MSRFKIASGIACVAAAALIGCQSDEDKLNEHLSRGDSYLEEKQYKEAIIEYKSALQLDPNVAAAHWGLAQSHLENQQPREGFWELRETVRLDPSNNEARLRFGQLSILAGELEDALSQADAVLKADPKNIQAHLLRAQTLESQKKYRLARNAYKEAVDLSPGTKDEALALRLLGNYYTRRGEKDAAGPAYEKLAEVAPEFNSFVALASHYVQNQKPEDAERSYKKAIEVAKPEDLSKAYGFLASFYYNQNRFEDAIRTLDLGIDELKQDPLDLIYLQSNLYEMHGDTAKAEELVRNAPARKPGDVRPFLVLSQYEARRGRVAESLAAISEALKLEPDNQDARVRKAELLVDTGFRDKDEAKLAEARSTIDALLKDNPTHADALLVRAKIDMAEGKAKESVGSLHAALEARPDWPQAHFLLGSALALQGDKTAARSELARAIELDATLVDARRLLAQIHQDLGEHEYAIEEARKYLRERPADTRVRITLAQSLVAQGKRDEAMKELEVVPAEARTPEVLFAFGQLYLAANQLPQARAALEKAIEQKPNSPDILKSLLALDLKENRFEDSVKRIDAAVAAVPNDGRLQGLHGTIALAAGKGDAAETAFKRAVELSPNDLTAYQRLATFYGRTGRLAEAVSTYEQALQKNPDKAEIHYMLGVLYEYSKERDKAVERYEDAIRRNPDLGEAKNNLAYIYAETGKNLDRALDLAQEAKALLPNNPNAADTLGWVLFKRKVPSAAIGFLREAESGYEAGDPSLGVVRHHLALAYEAAGDLAEAGRAAERGLKDLEASIADAKARNLNVGPEPEWAEPLRQILKRSQAAPPPAAPAAGQGG
jgi:tetratricopeptide (TPR) repeat protein